MRVIGDRTGCGAGEVVHPRRLAGSRDLRDDVLPAHGKHGADPEHLVEPAPAGDDGGGLVVLEADQPGRAGAEEPSELTDHRVEDLARGRATGHERRDAPQRCLLLRELGELLAVRAAGDRRRDQLGDLREVFLDAVGQRRALRHLEAHVAPRLAVDDDRRPGGRADPRTEARVRQVARERPLDILDPDQLAGSHPLRKLGERGIVPRPVGTGGERIRPAAPRAHDRHAPVTLPAEDLDHERPQHLPHLARDRGEHVR